METFKDRLLQIIDKLSGGKPTVFAKNAGIPAGTFHNYVSTGAVPKPDHLVRISEYSGVSIDWLLTGEGPVERGGGEEQAPSEGGGPVNVYILKKVILLIEETLKKNKKLLDPETKAFVISMAYDYVTEDAESEDDALKRIDSARGKILQFVKAA